MEAIFRFCPTQWPYRMAVGIQPGAFVRIARIEYIGENRIAYVYSIRGKHQCIHRVLLDDLKTPESTKPVNCAGCLACKAKCPIDKNVRRKLLRQFIPDEVVATRITPQVRGYLKAIGRLGGLRVTREKLWQLENARKRLAEARKKREDKSALFS